MFDFFKRQNSNLKKTKEDVLELIALAWNSLDSQLLADFLDDEVSYRSYGVCNVMTGKENYMKYLTGKFASQKEHGGKYNASVVSLDGDLAVKIDNENSVRPFAYLTIEYDGKKIQSMMMRPEIIYQLEDLQDSEKFSDIMLPILEKIRLGIEQRVTSLGFNQGHDFEWLQYWPSFRSPQFQHLNVYQK